MSVILMKSGESTDFSVVTAIPRYVRNGFTYYDSNGDLVEGTMLPEDGGTVIPSTQDITIQNGKYMDGDLIIKGDPFLIPNNIALGKEIFGVAGTCPRYGHKAEVINVNDSSSPIETVTFESDGGTQYQYSAIVLNNIFFTPTHASLWCYNGTTIKCIVSWTNTWRVGDSGLTLKTVASSGTNPSRFDSQKITLPISPNWGVIDGGNVYYTITGKYDE